MYWAIQAFRDPWNVHHDVAATSEKGGETHKLGLMSNGQTDGSEEALLEFFKVSAESRRWMCVFDAIPSLFSSRSI
jgi:hypothetical protein